MRSSSHRTFKAPIVHSCMRLCDERRRKKHRIKLFSLRILCLSAELHSYQNTRAKNIREAPCGVANISGVSPFPFFPSSRSSSALPSESEMGAPRTAFRLLSSPPRFHPKPLLPLPPAGGGNRRYFCPHLFPLPPFLSLRRRLGSPHPIPSPIPVFLSGNGDRRKGGESHASEGRAASTVLKKKRLFLPAHSSSPLFSPQERGSEIASIQLFPPFSAVFPSILILSHPPLFHLFAQISYLLFFRSSFLVFKIFEHSKTTSKFSDKNFE